MIARRALLLYAIRFAVYPSFHTISILIFALIGKDVNEAS